MKIFFIICGLICLLASIVLRFSGETAEANNQQICAILFGIWAEVV
mgnify:CR=1 FL=1